MFINTSKLSYNRAAKNFVAELSDFLRAGLPLPEIISVQSAISQRVVMYVFDRIEYDTSGEEVAAYRYQVAGRSAKEVPSSAGTSLTLLND